MASLACQRAGGTCVGSGLARISHEPLEAGSSTVAANLKPPDCSSPRLRSYWAANDRNGVLLGSVSGAAGVEGRRFTTSAHEGGASVCVFPETAQLLQRSESLLRNHHNSSMAQWPEANDRTQAVIGEASTLHVDPQEMGDDGASPAFLSLSSNSDEEELCSDSSSDSLLNSSAPSSNIEGPLDCLTALNEALPAKRGLSRCFAGKSQSFACLADVRSVADLAKPLNPFVKRRKTGSCVKMEACDRPKSVTERPVNSRRKTRYHVAATDANHGPTVDCSSDFVSLKCFSAPDLGEAGL